MTGRTSRIQKCMLCFQKICNFWENYNFIKKKIVKKLIFFSCDFKIFDGTIGCATKYSVFFVKNLPKLNILSVIAIDLVKIFKQTKKNHLAHFMKV